MNKIVELVINFEDLEFDDLGVEIISLVDRPAIEVEWMAFKEETEETEEDLIKDAILKAASDDSIGIKLDENMIFIDGTKNEFASVADVAQGVRALDVLDKITNQPKVMYRYRGSISGNSRNFCVAMVSLNKMYSKEEIDSISSIRPQDGMGPDGSNYYDIFKYKGGVSCKHYWEQLSVFERNGRTVVISEGATSGEAGEIASRSNDFWKFSIDDEQIVIGPAMIPNQLIPRRDELGNTFHVYFSEDTIKGIAKKFLVDNNTHNTDVNHNGDVVLENTLLESWIVEDAKMDKSVALGFNVPAGTWMVSYKINNKETWNKIKNKELSGYSVEGSFIEKLQS